MWYNGCTVTQGFGFLPTLYAAYTDDLESAFGINSPLIMIDLVSGCECSHRDKKFVADLFKVVEDEYNSLFNGIHERPSDILKLAQFFFANEVAHQRVDFDSSINPYLNVLIA